MKLPRLMRSAIEFVDRRPKPPGTLCPDRLRSAKGAGMRWDGTTPLELFIRKNNLSPAGPPLRVHLGCGQKAFEGYVNIDYPSEMHDVMRDVDADIFADISKLQCSKGSLKEIRLHHVFEHFDRVGGLAMLARWTDWLEVGGRLIIETPDLEGAARTFLRHKDLRTRMAVARHLAGDQSSSWGVHLEHWWPQRFRETLTLIGFEIEAAVTERWPEAPYLSNVVAVAVLKQRLDSAELRHALESILRNSMINQSEEATFEVWRKQLGSLLEPR